MNKPLFLTLAEQMPILCLHCTFHIQSAGKLPAFKGSTLHGWLGQQLLKQNHELYHLLYGSHENNQPKPYALVCLDTRTQWQPNDLLSFEVKLFGSAALLGEQFAQGISLQPLSFGKDRLKITIQSLASHTPQGLRLGIHPTRLVDWLYPIEPQLNHLVALQLQTPLRVKYLNNLLTKTPPSLDIIIKQTQRRLAQLVLFWHDEQPELQNELLPFGGFIGELGFYGDISNALIWLQIGQLLQIGGKTTFGLGCLQVLY